MKTQNDRIAAQLGAVKEVNLSEADAKYIACALDTEGTIGVYRSVSSDRPGLKYFAVCQVSNTNREFLEHLQTLVGSGRIRVISDRIGMKRAYVYTVSYRIIPKLLAKIHDFLIIKSQQSALVMRFYAFMRKQPARGGDRYTTYEKFYLECKALNKRGAP
jgi:hypothetical protein